MNNLNYGVIGNCRSAALVSEKGSIDWCCLPDFDSPSFLPDLLITTKEVSLVLLSMINIQSPKSTLSGQMCYAQNLNQTDGTFEVIDFMPRYKLIDDEYFAPAEIYRYIKYISGTPSFKVRYCPVFNYAREKVSNVTEDNYIRTYSRVKPTECIYLYSSLDFKDILDSKEIVLTQHQFLLLSYNQKLIDIDIKRVYLEFQRTKVYWLNWTNRSKKYEKYNEEIIRSLLVLENNVLSAYRCCTGSIDDKHP